MNASVSPQPRERVRWGAVLLFLVLAYGLGWAIASPLWFTGGIAPGGELNPLFFPLGIAVMFTPALAAVVVTLLVIRPAHPARFLGLVPLRPWRRTLGYTALAFVLPWVVGLAAVLLAAVTGQAHLQTNPQTGALLASIPLASALTAFAAFGEELGWRGFLLRALKPLGTWPALIISGAVWGPWHAPLILLGYNYGLYDLRAVVLMTISTIFMGVLFGWFRMRTGLVYPSSFAHGALNGSAGSFTAALLAVGADTVSTTVLGWAGWVVVGVLIIGLVIARTYRWTPIAGDGVDARPASAEAASDEAASVASAPVEDAPVDAGTAR